MDDWIGIAVALAVGVPLLVVAVLVDRRKSLRRASVLQQPPVRGSQGVDALVPTYISQDDVDALPRPGEGVRSAEPFSGGIRLSRGHLDADFATAGQVAELRDARILMVDGPVSLFRELLTPLSSGATGEPLVIVAESFHEEVLASLKANRRVARLSVVAMEANLAQLMLLQDEVGGQVLDEADLKSGWLPASALGRAARWRSDLSSTSVLGALSTKG